MQFLKLAIFLLISITLSACGGKKSVTKTTLVLGGTIDAVSGQNGGTMVYGRQTAGGDETFAIMLPFNEDLELANGTWSFAAISWDGVGGATAINDVMEGTVRCGLASVELAGGEQTISMSLASVNCKAQFFGDDSSKEADGQPLKFLPVTCAFTDPNSNRLEEYSCKNSVASGYRVELLQKLPGGAITSGLQSRCIAESNPTDRYLYNSSSLLRIPMFLPYRSDEPMIRVYLYDHSSCSNEFQVTNISHPLAGIADRPVELLSDDTTYTNENVFLIHNPPCLSPLANQTPPFNSEGNYVICNANQFATEISLLAGSNFYIGADINLGSLSTLSGPIVTANFTGNMDGYNHRLYGANFSGSLVNNTAIFQNFQGGIRNLRIEDSTYSVSGDVTNLGLFAGTLGASATVENIKFKNINVSLIGGGSGDKFGLVAGMYTPAGTSRVERVRADNIAITSSGYSNVGGLIGYSYTADAKINDVIINNISLSFDGTGFGNIGGVVGQMQNNSVLSSVNVRNIQIGTSSIPSGAGSVSKIGGLVGSLDNGSKVINARVSGSIYTESNMVGGAVGYSNPEAPTPGAAQTTLKDIASSVSPIWGGIEVGGVLGGTNGGTNGLQADLLRYYSDGSPAQLQGENNVGGLIGNMLGTASTPHNLTKSYVKNVGITSTVTNANIAGLVSKGVKINANEVFAESVTLSTTADASNKVGGLFGEFSDEIVLTDAFFVGDIVGATDGRSLMIYSVGAPSFVNYAYGYENGNNADNAIAITGSVTTAATYSNAIGADNVISTLSNFHGITDLNLDGYLSTAWINTDMAGEKRLRFSRPLELFANTATGSPDDPYQIASVASWNTIDDRPELMDKNFKLVSNLDFFGSTFVPIGSGTSPFNGILSAGGRTIQNVTVTDCGGEPIGIIGALSNIGIPRRIGVITEGAGNFVLDNIDFQCDDVNVGALVGSVLTDISDVNNKDHALEIENVVVQNSTLATTFVANSGSVGGLIGHIDINNSNSRIKNVSVLNSRIDGYSSSFHVGGVFGKFFSTGGGQSNSAQVESIRSIGNTITASNAIIGVGGIFGYYNSDQAMVEARKMIANNTITASDEAGGIVGTLVLGRISEAVARGSITSEYQSGGIVGYLSTGTTINGSYSEVSMNMTNVGGSGGVFAGDAYGTITNSWAAGSITGVGTLSYAVGTASFTGNLVYVGVADEGIGPEGVYVTETQFKNDATFFDTHFISVDPFVFTAGDYPRPYFEVFPQFFAQ